jgi:hypothetical protein
MKKFYDKLFSKIISISLTNNISLYIEKEQHIEEINHIRAIQLWAKKSWEKGIESFDLNKMMVSYILTELLFLFPENDLDWVLSENAKQKVRNFLEDLPERITLDVSPEPPKNASQDNKKYHSDYKEALKNNNYPGILSFLSAVAHGVGFHGRNDYFIKITARLSMIIAPSLFAINLSKFSPYLIRYYFEYLEQGQIVDVLINYQETNPLPLLIGIIKIVNPHGNNQFDEKILANYDLIEQASIIIEKLSRLIITNNLYKYITDCSNIFMNKLWHSIFSVFIARNIQYCCQYLDIIDFSYDVGENSFNCFMQYCNNIDDLDSFSINIYNKYLQYLIEKHTNQLVCFTSYFKYISQAIFTLSNKSHKQYLENIELVSIELKRGIYSWKKDEWVMLFTKWIFWLLSSKDYRDRMAIEYKSLSTTYELITDKKILDIIKFDSKTLLNLLENPGLKGSITIPVAGLYGKDLIIIKWDLEDKIYFAGHD